MSTPRSLRGHPSPAASQRAIPEAAVRRCDRRRRAKCSTVRMKSGPKSPNDATSPAEGAILSKPASHQTRLNCGDAVQMPMDVASTAFAVPRPSVWTGPPIVFVERRPIQRRLHSPTQRRMGRQTRPGVVESPTGSRRSQPRERTPRSARLRFAGRVAAPARAIRKSVTAAKTTASPRSTSRPSKRSTSISSPVADRRQLVEVADEPGSPAGCVVVAAVRSIPPL